MVEEAPKSRLGRGLAALIGDVGDETKVVERTRTPRRVPIEFLRPNPQNPRQTFDDVELEELAASIRERDIIQPIVVRTITGIADAFEIIAGERRWRAAQRVGLRDVPVVLVEASDREALEMAIIENVQRADLNALDEARGYETLIQQFGYSQSDLSRVVGKSRSHVANTLRLGRLPEVVKGQVKSGVISAGHARALLAVADPEAVAKRVVAQGLNVRDVERIAQREAEESGGVAEGAPSRRPKPEKDADTRALEKALSDVLGLAVSIEHRPNGGSVLIKYRTVEQLEAICRRLQAAAGSS